MGAPSGKSWGAALHCLLGCSRKCPRPPRSENGVCGGGSVMSRDLSPEGARRMLGMHAAALRWPGNDAGGAAPGMGAPVSVASRSFVPRGQRPRGGLYLPAARLASAALEGRAGRFEGSLLVAFRGSRGWAQRGHPSQTELTAKTGTRSSRGLRPRGSAPTPLPPASPALVRPGPRLPCPALAPSARSCPPSALQGPRQELCPPWSLLHPRPWPDTRTTRID